MSPRTRIILMLLIVVMAAAPRLPAGSPQRAWLKDFSFHGQRYALNAFFARGQSDLLLQGAGEKNLSAGMGGENILLGTQSGQNNFYIFWIHYGNAQIRLACYDFKHKHSQILPLSGFSFIGLPEIIEENGDLQGLIFLGNRSKNDDIFYYKPKNDLLTALTATPYSEKGFTLEKKDGQLVVATRSLWEEFRYRFDRASGQSVLFERQNRRSGQTSKTATATPEYYNTYIGFGDSITAGYMEGLMQPELGYLAQMRDRYLAVDYGPADFINLGIGGDGTMAGAERIDQELNANSSFYFLLMLGVNDAIDTNLSVDSALENLAYIMDAALARGMRVIVSTLTPRKDPLFSSQEYYWRNLHALSAGILALAAEKGTPSIDTLSAFMDSDPPYGWKDLLETPRTILVDGELREVKGNHPNAAGHRLIASLFAGVLVAFPPLPPTNIAVSAQKDKHQQTVYWSPGYESDFSHFHIEFGFLPQELDYRLDVTPSFHTFTLFPFLPQLYFRIQSVDRSGHASAFSDPPGTPPQGGPPGRLADQKRLKIERER